MCPDKDKEMPFPLWVCPVFQDSIVPARIFHPLRSDPIPYPLRHCILQ